MGREIGFSNARVFSSLLFTMKVKKNLLSFARFRIVVSKKTQSLAVRRNRLRRILSSCLEGIKRESLSGYDFLFIIKKEMWEKSQSETRQMIKQVFKEAGFLV